METWLSNGLGGQSMYLLWAIREGKLQATVSITADTGSEEDCQLATGERITARDFFQRHVKPLAESAGVEALFVRSKDKHGNELPPLKQIIQISSQQAARGNSFAQTVSGLSVPLFTNDKSQGRLMQSCTDKWKVRAIKQTARARGVKKLRSIIGYHYDEAARRINGVFIGNREGFDHYKPYRAKKMPGGSQRKIVSQWEEQVYPLVDWRMGREEVAYKLRKHGIPYLVTSECDICPHKDYERWARHSPEVLQKLAEIEAGWDGKLFFTSYRIPLLEAIELMAKQEPKQKKPMNGLLFSNFGCQSEICGI